MAIMNVLVDQDEVCAHWVQEVLDSHNAEHGTKYTRADIKNYFAMETLDPKLKKTTLAHLDKPGLYKSLKPFDGAIAGLKELNDLRIAGEKAVELFIVSSVPSGVSFDEKKIWNLQHIPFLPKENFGAWARKDVIIGQVLLDDATHHLRAFAATGRLAAVFDSPWNADLPALSVDELDMDRYYHTLYRDLEDKIKNHCVRVKSWPEFVVLIKKYLDYYVTLPSNQ